MSAVPEATRLFVLRHGRTAFNAEWRMQGQLDIGLDALGQAQAAALVPALQGEGIDAIYSSDLERARQTVEPLAAALRLPVQLDAGLRERHFGDFQGLPYRDIEARWPEDTARWRRRDTDWAPAGGESLLGFYRRTVDAVLRLAERHAGQVVVVATHGGVLDCLYRAARRIELQAPRTWALDNATVNRMLWTPQGLSLVGWNDVGHLAGLTPNPAGEHARSLRGS